MEGSLQTIIKYQIKELKEYQLDLAENMENLEAITGSMISKINLGLTTETTLDLLKGQTDEAERIGNYWYNLINDRLT